jgi:hypothetical protein
MTRPELMALTIAVWLARFIPPVPDGWNPEN